MTQSRCDDDCRKGMSDSNPQSIFGRHAQYNVAVSLETGHKCQIVIIIGAQQNVTFSRKTYTDAFPLNRKN